MIISDYIKSEIGNRDLQNDQFFSNQLHECLNNSKSLIIDPIDLSILFQNRNSSILIREQAIEKIGDSTIQSPANLTIINSTKTSELLKILTEKSIEFPIIIKPLPAQSSDQRYEMTIIPSIKAFKKNEKTYNNCVFEKFINHNGILFKLYTLFKFWYVVKRSSFNNIDPSSNNDTCIQFETNIFNQIHKMDQTELKSHINDTKQEPKLCYDNKKPQNNTEYKIFNKIAVAIQKVTNCQLLGIDVIRDTKSSNYYIIDINYFPSYRYIPTFKSDLLSQAYEFITQNKLLNS
ncbi:hypothetical protein HZS_6184 [Henneguya salminicola]|nr:hypothetical protein HZS_6184 [Henneguya salminicola]